MRPRKAPELRSKRERNSRIDRETFDVRRLQAISQTVDAVIDQWARSQAGTTSPKLAKAYNAFRRDLQTVWELVLWRAPAVGMSAEELRAAFREPGVSPQDIVADLRAYAVAAGQQHARTRRKNRKAGKHRGQVRREDTLGIDVEIKRVSKDYRNIYPYSYEHSTRQLAAYVARQLDLPFNTVRGRLKTLNLR